MMLAAGFVVLAIFIIAVGGLVLVSAAVLVRQLLDDVKDPIDHPTTIEAYRTFFSKEEP